MATPTEVARLAAGAQGGTAGVAAFDQAQAQVNSAKTSALRAVQSSPQGYAGPLPSGAMSQLTSQVEAPAQAALRNLQQGGAAAAAASNAGTAATNLYTQEAAQAIPVINAEAARDLAQKEAMLAATTSRATAAAPKQLSDAQLRVDLLGAAQQERATQAAAAQQALGQTVAGQVQGLNGAQAAAAQQANLVVTPGMGRDAQFNPALFGVNQPVPQAAPPIGQPAATAVSGALGALGINPASFPALQPGAPNYEAAISAQAQADQAARLQALNNIRQLQYGPGITSTALGIAQPAINAGLLDPFRVQGLLTPQVDQAYVNANIKQGLYANPNNVTNTVLPVTQAAQRPVYAPGQPNPGPLTQPQMLTALRSNYFDWTGDTKLQAAFQKWLTTVAPTTDPQIATKPIAAQQAEFVASPGAQALQKNVVSDIVNEAHFQITRGLDYGTFATIWQQDPVYRQDPQAVALGLAMVAPLFQYAAARTRTVNPAAATGG